MANATAAFTLDEFVEQTPFLSHDQVLHARARIAKTFTGDLVGSSTVEMLMVRVDGEGAGYVAIEHVVGSLDGRMGTFSLLHVGTMDEGQPWAMWPIVPGSGTGDLGGIRGEARIAIDAHGAHSLTLEFELT